MLLKCIQTRSLLCSRLHASPALEVEQSPAGSLERRGASRDVCVSLSPMPSSATWVQAEELLAHMLQLPAQACHLNLDTRPPASSFVGFGLGLTQRSGRARWKLWCGSTWCLGRATVWHARLLTSSASCAGGRRVWRAPRATSHPVHVHGIRTAPSKDADRLQTSSISRTRTKLEHRHLPPVTNT